MSFKRFIYYCMICGGWAAFMAWGLAALLDLYSVEKNHFVAAAMIGAILGLLVTTTIGFLDALLNAVGFQRILRTFVCMIVGLFSGLLGGLLAEALYSIPFGSLIFYAIGWAITGMAIGASLGVYDLLRAIMTKQPLRMAVRKLMNGMVGGVLGGVLGGLALGSLGGLFRLVFTNADEMNMPHAVGLVILGMCIGLLIGTAQVVLKEAWVKVEAGFKPGREVMLSKPETVVGRAEGTDIALFGDKDVEKMHAKIVLQAGRYMLLDNGTPGGTFLNGEKISKPSPLRSGDLIQMGKSALRFGERQKRQ